MIKFFSTKFKLKDRHLWFKLLDPIKTLPIWYLTLLISLQEVHKVFIVSWLGISSYANIFKKSAFLLKSTPKYDFDVSMGTGKQSTYKRQLYIRSNFYHILVLLVFVSYLGHSVIQQSTCTDNSMLIHTVTLPNRHFYWY